MAKHDSLLHKICDSLQPMFYKKYCNIVRKGDPIDAVFFITDGIVRTYTSNNGEGSDSQHATDLEKDKCFGRELLELVLTSNDISNLSKVPVSSKTLKTYTKVEAFALMAHDLKQIWQSKHISKCKRFLVFYTKNLLFFYFTHQFLQNSHISLFILHIYLIKYSFFTIFYYFLTHYSSLSHTQHYQKKNTKILYAQSIVTVHICTATITLIHLCTILYPLM